MKRKNVPEKNKINPIPIQTNPLKVKWVDEKRS
jgi:hypothetical protein